MTDADIKNLAHLARIGITDQEVQTFKSEIGPILDYVAQINAVSVDSVSDEAILKNNFRPDGVVSADRDTLNIIEGNAPEMQDGFYKVPKIL